MAAKREEVKKRLKADGVQYVLSQFVDMHGAAKAKMSPVECLDMLVDEGVGFAGAALWGMGQGPHSHDMMARIDLDTYTPLPWQPNTARFAADLFVDGEPWPYCARTNLRRVLAGLERQGLRLNVGVEPEHFLVQRDGSGGIAPWDPQGADRLAKPCYDFKGIAPAMGYLQEVTAGLNRLGWEVYQTDHEDANGQYEVNFKYADALVTADRFVFFKMMTSQVAARHGAIATHMPKPFSDRTGSGAHLHYHVADAKSGKNLFEDLSDKRRLGLSKTAYHFLGGILKHARALCAVMSPTVNCYKRLLIGHGLTSPLSGFTWTPAFLSYGDNNRTQMLRVAGPGHVEDRTGSAGTNLYLALAAYAEAGMDGVKKGIDPGEPFLGNLYELGLEEIKRRGIAMLPQSLKEALEEFEKDKVVRDALGPIQDEFLRLKRQEWTEYHRQISPWEIGQYLTMF